MFSWICALQKERSLALAPGRPRTRCKYARHRKVRHRKVRHRKQCDTENSATPKTVRHRKQCESASCRKVRHRKVRHRKVRHRKVRRGTSRDGRFWGASRHPVSLGVAPASHGRADRPLFLTRKRRPFLGCLETPFSLLGVASPRPPTPFPYAHATAVFGVPRDTPFSLGVAPPASHTAGPTDPFSLRMSNGRFWGASRHPIFAVGSCATTAANLFSLRVRDGRFWGASRHPNFVVGSFFPYITPCRLLDAKRPLTFSLQVIPAAHPVTFSLPSLFSRRAFSFQ